MPKTPEGHTRAATIQVLLAAVLWSAGGLGVKSIEASALSLAGYRSLFAIPVLLLAATIEAGRKQISPWPMLRRKYVWMAAGSYAVMVICFVVSAKLTTAANAILLQYTGPVYVALFSWPLLRERVRAIDGVATAGCVLGMVLFFLDKVSAQGRLGNVFAIASSFGFAGVPLLMRLEQRSQGASWPGQAASPFVAMALGNAVAVVFCAREMITHPLATPTAWLIVVALGAIQIGAAYWLYGSAVGRMPALRSTLLATIEPILSPVWVALFRGELPTRWAVVGGSVILVSVTAQALVKGARVPASDPLDSR